MPPRLSFAAKPLAFFADRPRRGLVVCGLALVASACLPGAASAQLTVAALIGDSVSEPDSPRYSDISEGIKRFTGNDLLSARQFLESAKRKHPKLPPVGVMLAKMHAIVGNSNAVRPALEQSINQEADDPEPYLLLAESTLQSGQTIEADALFDKAVQLVGGYDVNAKRKRKLKIRAYRGRAAVAERRGKWAGAEADLNVWIKEDPKNASAQSRLGQVLCMLDRVDEGRERFIQAKQLDANLPSPFVMTARMYERRGKQAEAITEFRKAYDDDPKDETTLVTYAQALIRGKQLTKAAQVLKTARSAVPGSANVWLLTGVTARMAGSPDNARRALQQALTLQPGNRDAYDQLAQVLAGSDDATDKALGLQYAVAATKLFPNNADSKITLSWVLFQNGRGRESTATFQNAVKSSGGAFSADSRVMVARLLIAGNRPDSAKAILQSALKEDTGIFVLRAEAEKLLATL